MLINEDYKNKSLNYMENIFHKYFKFYQDIFNIYKILYCSYIVKYNL